MPERKDSEFTTMEYFLITNIDQYFIKFASKGSVVNAKQVTVVTAEKNLFLKHLTLILVV